LQVAILKSATTAIHDEVQDQNRMLGGMVRSQAPSLAVEHRDGIQLCFYRCLPSPALQGDTFDRAGGLMSGTLKRLDGLIKYAGGSSHMCSLIGFIVFTFVLVWWMFLRG
jgi:hypothetical protein